MFSFYYQILKAIYHLIYRKSYSTKRNHFSKQIWQIDKYTGSAKYFGNYLENALKIIFQISITRLATAWPAGAVN